MEVGEWRAVSDVTLVAEWEEASSGVARDAASIGLLKAASLEGVGHVTSVGNMEVGEWKR
ncbi:hypothetical protein M6D81_29935 [Paenibacillus sp. J5C_2022]|nr:hypothetical protein [Paenibacillus sp. J5C2022]